MTNEIKSDQTPLEQAEAYFTECVIIANETEDIQDRKRKFEKAKQTTVGFLNFQIDYWLQVRAEFEQIISITDKAKPHNEQR
jgi:hypothetical protein